ncbi:NAD(P)-dependent oxidoreductase [Aquamicrobium sp. LC103]|uniref:NAD(P)-dependent oxidoreductase n=1 Tax=Aquamicrobium sp. LC103 TaxID=1120658 RepID=UPI00063E96B0|nr:NAD(P)-dependent oxidoreductase [Aquamicrobium sp. LC103]TKT69464.1 hydroxyacid dehydrogenase [Aquamicrobium sp. LC103]
MSSARIFLSHPETARTWWYGKDALASLQELGEVVLNRTDDTLSGINLAKAAAGCRVMILDRATAVSSGVMEALPDLVAIVRSGVETRHVDVAAASKRGILVTRSNPGYIASTAELILAHMLNCARDIPDYVMAYRSGGVRSPSHGLEMAGSTAGLIGYGRIARHLGRVLDVMGVSVLAYDPYTEVEPPARSVSLQELLEVSDFVVPILAATGESANLLDEKALGSMKKGAFLINASRGDIVDERALVAALDEGRIRGAGLDVGWGPDQTPSPALATHACVNATPHIGNLTTQAAARHPADTVAQTAQILAGRIPFGALNPDHAHRLRATTTR